MLQAQIIQVMKDLQRFSNTFVEIGYHKKRANK